MVRRRHSSVRSQRSSPAASAGVAGVTEAGIMPPRGSICCWASSSDIRHLPHLSSAQAVPGPPRAIARAGELAQRRATCRAEARTGAIANAAVAALEAGHAGEQALAAGGAEAIDRLVWRAAAGTGDPASGMLRLRSGSGGGMAGDQRLAAGGAETLMGRIGVLATGTDDPHLGLAGGARPRRGVRGWA